MSSLSSIEWTNSTWNPVTGCTKISSGCKNCYAERMTNRLFAMGAEAYQNKFEVTLHSRVVDLPLSWKKPKVIFVNSMSDLFHEKVPLDFIKRVYNTIEAAHWHQFQILTKRSERLLDLSSQLSWPDNLWMGVSVESKNYKYRIAHLAKTPAKIKFVSLEPLLGPLGIIPLKKIDWVIAGGESGPGARKVDANWVRAIRDQCIKKGTPFFFKQWGGVWKKKTGRELDGKYWNELPEKFPEKIIDLV